MSKATKDIEFKIPEGVVSNTCNAYRMGFSESDLLIDFGEVVEETKDNVNVNISNRISMPMRVLKDMISMLVQLSNDYSEKYGIDSSIEDSNID